MENVKSCSLAELENMEQETYQLLDIRSMEAFDHGHLKDALNIPANELIERKDELQTEKKIIVYCQSGVISTDQAELLSGFGFDACSLEGGYDKWLLNHFQETARNADIEKSIRKKFRKTIWSPFTKAVKQYELVKEGDKKPIILRISDDNMEINIQSQLGSMQEDIDIEKTGKDIMIGFNPKFLIDALRVIDDENVTIYMVNPKAPCYIKDDEQKYVYLILPVNFNTAVN